MNLMHESIRNKYQIANNIMANGINVIGRNLVPMLESGRRLWVGIDVNDNEEAD